MEEAIDLVLANQFPMQKYSDEERNDIIAELKAREEKAINRRDRARARQFAKCHTRLASEWELFAMLTKSRQHAKEMKVRLAKTRRNSCELVKRWADVAEGFREQAKEEIEKMKEETHRKLQEEKKKRKEPLSPRFRKHSYEYMMLLARKKALEAAKQEEEAQKIEKEMEKLDEIDQQRMRIEWEKFHDRRVAKIEKELQDEVRRREEALKKDELKLNMAMKRDLDSANAQTRHVEQMFEKEYRHFGGRRRASPSISGQQEPESAVPRLDMSKVKLTWNAFKSPDSQHVKRWVNRKIYTRIPATAR
jgi:hypothetical protein